MSLIYKLEDLKKISSHTLTGHYPAIEALSILLEDTGLVYEKTTKNTIAIRKDHHQAQVEPQPKADASKAENKKSEPLSADSQVNNTDTAVQSGKPSKKQARQGESEPSDDFMLEEVVVTASKMGETKLQETPIAISSLSFENLKNSGTYRMDQLGHWVPNAEFSSPVGYPQAFIRGIGNTQIGTLMGDANVAFYVDGVYLEGGFGVNADFMDIERIEILRGPQGTLYGRAANGGAVNIITKPPADELEITLSAEYGKYDKRRLEGTISGPIYENKLKARLAFADSNRDAYMKNISGKDPEQEDFTAFRGKLTFTPNDLIDIDLAADYYKSDTNGPGYKMISDQGVFGAVFGFVLAPGFYTTQTAIDPKDEREVWGTSAKIHIQLPREMSLTSLTSYRKFEDEIHYDRDGTDVILVEDEGFSEIEQFSEELHLQAQWNQWKWIAGAIFYVQETNLDYTQFVNGMLFGLSPDFTLSTTNIDSLETTAYALFSNVRYAVNDRLGLEAGIRYSVEEKKRDAIVINEPSGVIPDVDESVK
ncbi:MAG: TonB-dependent receptor, partial [Deltaproteobacteria bacterium]|nr:TonB-dependent receptor [Deltaproteobacteria bacterium]